LAALVVVIVSCSDVQRAAPTTTPVTSVVGQPSTTTALPSSTSIASTTTRLATTTTVPAPELIIRPYVDPKVCGDPAKANNTFQLSDWVPFAVAGPQRLPIQVFAQPTNGIAQPFAVLLRISKTLDRRTNDHPWSINGAHVSIDIVGNGNASAAWTLPDGTWAYLRARDLDQAAIVALISRLTPRNRTAPIPGFDLAPSTSPGHLVLVHEHMNSGLKGTSTRFQCTTTPGGWVYRVDVVTGDPTAIYVALIDRSRVYAIGVNGTGAISINGPKERAITLAMVVNADPATWKAIRPIGPTGA
jgi:hypothetical protein